MKVTVAKNEEKNKAENKQTRTMILSTNFAYTSQ